MGKWLRKYAVAQLAFLLTVWAVFSQGDEQVPQEFQLHEGAGEITLIRTAQENLDTLFAEGLDYIHQQGWPFFGNSEELQRQTELMFWFIAHPAPHHGYIPTAEDDKRTVAILKAQADAGDAHGQYVLGVYSLLGKQVPQDYTQGILLINKAAKSKAWEAAYNLARMYEIGLHVPVDKQKAAELYKTSAETAAVHSSVAENRLGEMYE